MKNFKSSYEIGDIVFVSKYTYDDGTEGENHLFVIIDDEKVGLMPVEYFGLIVSSNRKKSNENSTFKYNEPLKKNNTNNLDIDSIVKCDILYTIPPQNILFKIGSIDVDDYLRFIKSYKISVEEKVA